MAWFILIIAGLFEVGWAIGLKYTEGFTRLWPTVGTVLAMVISLGLLGIAMKSLPVGTAYAIWVGVGAVGTVILGIVLLGEPANPIDEVVAQRDVGIEQQQPLPLAEADPLVDGPGEAVIAFPAAKRYAGPAAQSWDEAVGGGMVIDDHDLDAPAAGGASAQRLAGECGRVFPLVVVDDDGGESRRRQLPGGAGAGRSNQSWPIHGKRSRQSITELTAV